MRSVGFLARILGIGLVGLIIGAIVGFIAAHDPSGYNAGDWALKGGLIGAGIGGLLAFLWANHRYPT